PPLEAGGSSLLYSREFYASLKPRLAEGGVLQQWIPGGAPEIVASFVRTAKESFPYVRSFSSVENWGVHLLCSLAPLPPLRPHGLARHMPEAAARDLVEWGPARRAEDQFEILFKNEEPVEMKIWAVPDAPVLCDDRPFNEYFLLR